MPESSARNRSETRVREALVVKLEPLAGFTVAVTADRRADEQAALLTRLGATVVHGPVIRTESVTDRIALLDAARSLVEQRPDVVILTTAVGVRAWLTEADSGFEGLPRRFAPGPYLRRVVRTSSWRRAERPIGVARRMGRAVREVAADADTDHVVIVSHQFPIVMARIALTWGVTDDAGPIAVRAAPLLFRRTGCALASVSSLRFDDRERASIDYWEP